jgi:cytoskeletal protein CcmA (bactofilin family)
MFQRRKPVSQKRIESLIGAGTVVRGDVVFTGGLRIDGEVEGNVTTADGQAGTLVVSEAARVNGGITVSHVVVNGAVKGAVAAREYLELQRKARVDGDVTYRALEMHAGATVTGRLHRAEPGTAEVVELKRAIAE